MTLNRQDYLDKTRLRQDIFEREKAFIQSIKARRDSPVRTDVCYSRGFLRARVVDSPFNGFTVDQGPGQPTLHIPPLACVLFDRMKTLTAEDGDQGVMNRKVYQTFHTMLRFYATNPFEVDWAATSIDGNSLRSRWMSGEIPCDNEYYRSSLDLLLSVHRAG